VPCCAKLLDIYLFIYFRHSTIEISGIFNFDCRAEKKKNGKKRKKKKKKSQEDVGMLKIL